MKIDRIFKIVYLFMGRDRMTVRELAEHFEVSARTIHRDIDSLMQAGIPIYTSRGSEGGVSLVDGFVLDETVLSEEEQEQILIGLQSLPGSGSLDTAVFENPASCSGNPMPTGSKSIFRTGATSARMTSDLTSSVVR